MQPPDPATAPHPARKRVYELHAPLPVQSTPGWRDPPSIPASEPFNPQTKRSLIPQTRHGTLALGNFENPRDAPPSLPPVRRFHSGADRVISLTIGAVLTVRFARPKKPLLPLVTPGGVEASAILSAGPLPLSPSLSLADSLAKGQGNVTPFQSGRHHLTLLVKLDNARGLNWLMVKTQIELKNLNRPDKSKQQIQACG